MRNHTIYVEALNFGYRNKRSRTISAANNKGADQNARMRRLICAFAVRIWHKQIFSWRGLADEVFQTGYYNMNKLHYLVLYCNRVVKIQKGAYFLYVSCLF